MPTFDTPEPVTVAVSALVADIAVRASERRDTAVTVSPGDPTDTEDVDAAAGTRVEHVSGRIEVRVPKSWRRFRPGRSGGAVDLAIDLPTGSGLEVSSSIADVRVDGRVGACRLSASVGTFSLDETGPLRGSTYGVITVERVRGDADVTGGQSIRIGRVDGDAEVRNQAGEIHVGEVTGTLRARTSTGPIVVGVAGERVEARSADGEVRVGAVASGAVDLRTALGAIEVGIVAGTAAQLEVTTDHGRLRNELDHVDGPGDAERTATVRAHTSMGDVVLTRPHAAVGDDR